MKKFLTLFLSVCAVLCASVGLASCGDDGPNEGVKPGEGPEHICSYSGEWQVEIPGSCDIRAREFRQCSCGEREYRDGNFSHNYQTVQEKPATCFETGHNEYERCVSCGDIKGFVSYDMVEHDFGDWEEISVQSCTDWGVKERYCENVGCYAYEREEEEPLDHDLTSSLVKRTETTSGYTKYTCQRQGCSFEDIDNEEGPLLYFEEYKTGEIEVGASYVGDVSWVTKITVPDTYKGMPVTKLGSFVRFRNLEEVIIQYNTSEVKPFTYGASAFENCSKLEYITPMNNAVVENYAFRNCTSLNVDDFAIVKSVGEYAFSNCSSLEEFAVVSSESFHVTTIGYGAFTSCTSLKKLHLPKGSLNAKFNNANQLEGKTLKSYFGGNVPASLTTLDLTPVTEIGECAFENCANLTSIKINPFEGMFIANTAFNGCSGLTYVETENGRYVNPYNDQYVLVEVLDKTVSTFDIRNNTPIVLVSHVFENCANLTKVNFMFDNPVSIGDYAFANCQKLTDINLSSVRMIGANAFENCKSLYSVDFSNYIREIKDNAFLGCSNLVSVKNNSTLQMSLGAETNGKVCYYAQDLISGNKQHAIDKTNGFVTFTKNEVCSLLGYIGTEEEITIPSTVQVIKAYAIPDGVKKLTVPETVEKIEGFALNRAKSLVKLFVPFVGETRAQSVEESSSKNTAFWWIFGKMDNIYAYYDVPTTLKYVEITGDAIIPTYAFKISKHEKYPISYEELVISGQPQKMGNYILNAEHRPSKITLPYVGEDINTPKSLENVFYDRNREIECLTIMGGKIQAEAVRSYVIDMLVLGDEVSVEKDAFKWSTDIKAISVGKNFTSFNTTSAFLLENLYYRGTVEEYFEKGLSLGKGVNSGSVNNESREYINFYFLNEEGEWYQLKEVVVPESLTTISSYQFSQMNLDKLVIPSSVTNIAEYAFGSCFIKELVIENGVGEIAYNAFSSEYYIKKIYFEGTQAEWESIFSGYLSDIEVVFCAKSAIAYKAVIGGEVVDIPSVCFETNGNYPTTYVEGVGVSVSALKAKAMSFEQNGSGADYDFEGWFTDAACTTPFTGIDGNARGEITVYAKLSVAYYTPTV